MVKHIILYIKRLINRILPVESSHRHKVTLLLKKYSAARKSSTSSTYDHWIRVHERELFFSNNKYSELISSSPRISIIVPFYNTPNKYLKPVIKSVKSQVYENWQLCAVDGSTDIKRSEAIRKACQGDDRITYVRLKKNKGIVGNTNAGLKHCHGEYVAFMDHDDTLSEYALAEVVVAINDNPQADLIYSDEDKLTDDGRMRTIPFFKPDWNPELLLSVNYISHFTIVRKTIIDKIGGLRPGMDGAQDYDLLLRVTEITENIVHIPKVLYHWRLAEGSTAVVVDKKDYATTAGMKALQDALKRRRLGAEVVEIPERPTNYRLRYYLPDRKPRVSIIIPFKDKAEYLETLIPSILKSNYENYEIILISNNSREQATKDYLQTLKNEKRCKLYEWNHPFNYSAVNNFGRSKALGTYLVFLNNDTEVLDTEWLNELIGVAVQPGNGAVGPMLLYPDGRVQHAGVVLGMKTMAGHVFRLRRPEEWTDFGLPLWPRNYLAVTGACLVVSTKKFDEIGGFDETMVIAGSDVALCLRLHEKGYRNVFWPFTRLTHFENVSVGDYDNNVPIGDYNRSLEYYRPYLSGGDEYFNPNLDLMNEQVGIGGSNRD